MSFLRAIHSKIAKPLSSWGARGRGFLQGFDRWANRSTPPIPQARRHVRRPRLADCIKGAFFIGIRPQRASQGFVLLEMLTAMGVFALAAVPLIVLVYQCSEVLMLSHRRVEHLALAAEAMALATINANELPEIYRDGAPAPKGVEVQREPVKLTNQDNEDLQGIIEVRVRLALPDTNPQEFEEFRQWKYRP